MVNDRMLTKCSEYRCAAMVLADGCLHEGLLKVVVAGEVKLRGKSRFNAEVASAKSGRARACA